VIKKRQRVSAIKILLLILQHCKHWPLQSSPLYWRYTVPNFSSIVGMLPGTHCDGAQFSYHIFLNLLYGLETMSFQSVLFEHASYS
jgi:hypothetical protein